MAYANDLHMFSYVFKVSFVKLIGFRSFRTYKANMYNITLQPENNSEPVQIAGMLKLFFGNIQNQHSPKSN